MENNNMSKLVLNLMNETMISGTKETSFNQMIFTTDRYELTLNKMNRFLTATLYSNSTMKEVTYYFADMKDFRNNLK